MKMCLFTFYMHRYEPQTGEMHYNCNYIKMNPVLLVSGSIVGFCFSDFCAFLPFRNLICLYLLPKGLWQENPVLLLNTTQN